MQQLNKKKGINHPVTFTGWFMLFHRGVTRKLYGMFFLVGAIVFHSASVHAQFSMGLATGVNSNQLSTNISNRSYTRYENRTGFQISVPLNYALNRWFAVQTGPGLLQKNYSITRTGAYAGVYETHTNTYLQLPLLIQGGIAGKRLKVFVSLGLYGAWWMAGRMKGTVPDILNIIDSTGPGQQPLLYSRLARYDQKYTFDKKKDNRLEAGWLSGIGMGYRLKNNFSLIGELRYWQSLTDQQKKYMAIQVPRYNETWSLSIGCMIEWNRKTNQP